MKKNSYLIQFILIFIYSNWLFANNYNGLENDLNHRANKILNKIKEVSNFRGQLELKIVEIMAVEKNDFWIKANHNHIIKMTKKALFFCYKDGNAIGDQRLAFLLGHEIYHIKCNHVDYIKNFMADFKDHPFLSQIREIEELKNKAQTETDKKKFVQELISKLESIHNNEMQADEHGLMFAAIAGYKIKNIIDYNGKNFFQQWEERLRKDQSSSSLVYPSSKERLKNLKNHIKNISKNIWLFHAGLRLSKIKKYDDALELFQAFNIIFPGSAVSNNIGMTYYQKAIHSEDYSKCKNKFQFKLSTDYDYRTNARVYQEVPRTKNRFKLIQKASKAFKTSYEIDSDNYTAYINDSSMDLISSLCLSNSKHKLYFALGTLQMLNPKTDSANYLKIINNYAIAKYLADKTKIDDAIKIYKNCLTKIQQENDHQWLDKDIFNVCYNLKQLYFKKGIRDDDEKIVSLLKTIEKYKPLIPCKKELDGILKNYFQKTKNFLENIQPGKCYINTIKEIEKKIKNLNKNEFINDDDIKYVVYENNEYMICIKEQINQSINILFIEKTTKNSIEDILANECLDKIRQKSSGLPIFLENALFEIKDNHIVKELYY